MAETVDRKIYSRRPMRGLTASEPSWAQLGDPDGAPLSDLLSTASFESGRLFLCGSLEQMSREYVEEPLRNGWGFARSYIHKFRSPVYRQTEYKGKLSEIGIPKEISVKLVGESWLPGCEDMRLAIPAWHALKAEWSRHTEIPLLSTPSKTGQALLWESLPRGVDFPALPDDLATLIRGVSPQHRLQVFSDAARSCGELYAYDGRWMYAGCALTDRLPIGEARKTSSFTPYQPGWYRVEIKIPETWAHIGLIPVQAWDGGEKAWSYPSAPGAVISGWVSEPELTLALSHGWELMDVRDGYVFDKGRPLAGWTKKLIEMRSTLQILESGQDQDGFGDLAAKYNYASAAIREILNHTIGSFHVNTYEREAVVSNSEWKELIEQHGYAKIRTLEKLRGNKRRVVYPARHSDRLSIYMPHWSAQIWALERAWIAKHALMCDLKTLVEIRGDAIYSTCELPFADNGNLSQLRPKEV